MKLQHILSSFLVLGSIITSSFLDAGQVASPMKPSLDSKNTQLRTNVSIFNCVCKQIIIYDNAVDLERVVLSHLNAITKFSQLNLQQNRDDCITFSTIKNAIQWAHIEFTKKLGELTKLMAASETDESTKAKIEGNIGVLQKIVYILTYYIAKQNAIEKSPTRPDFENKLLMKEILKLNLVYDEILNADYSTELKKEFYLLINSIINRYVLSKDSETFSIINNEMKLALNMLSWKKTELKKIRNPETGEFKNPEIKRKTDFLQEISVYLQKKYLNILLIEINLKD